MPGYPRPADRLARSAASSALPPQRFVTPTGLDGLNVSTTSATLAARPARRGSSPLTRRKAIEGYLYISPFLLGFLIFTAYPLLASLYLSFTSYNILSAPTWIGLENYQRAFTQDPQFWASLGRTIRYALLVVPIGLDLLAAGRDAAEPGLPRYVVLPDDLLPAVDYARDRVGADLALDSPAFDRRRQLPPQSGWRARPTAGSRAPPGRSRRW